MKKNDSAVFICTQVEKLLKVHTLKTFSPLVKFDSQGSIAEFPLCHVMPFDWPPVTHIWDRKIAELYYDRNF